MYCFLVLSSHFLGLKDGHLSGHAVVLMGGPSSRPRVRPGAALGLALSLLQLVKEFLGIEGLLVAYPAVLKAGFTPESLLQWPPLLWGVSWALGLRLWRRFRGPSVPVRKSSNGAAPELEASPEAIPRGLLPSPAVGIFLFPLFLASCIHRRATGATAAVSRSSSAPLEMLPSALATAGAQGAVLGLDCVAMPQVLLLAASWLLALLVEGPWGPHHCCMFMGASLIYLWLMLCWDKEGRKALSFSEASTLSQMATAAALCFTSAWGEAWGIPFMGLPALESQGPQVDRGVLSFLGHMYILLMLLCLFFLGALFLPKGPSRASYLGLVTVGFLTAVCFYLVFGESPEAGSFSDAKRGPLLWLVAYIVVDDQHTKLLLLLLATSAAGLTGAFVLAARVPQQDEALGTRGLRDEKLKAQAQQPGGGEAASWLPSLRKVFHFLVVGNLLLVFIWGAISLLLLAMGGLLWLVVAVEALRVSEVWPAFSRCVEFAYEKFSDWRDAHSLVVTHIYMVMGVTAPCLVVAGLTGAFEAAPCLLGIVLVGCGDSFAAIVGSRCASPRLPGSSNKTVAGLLAFIVGSLSVGFSLCCLFTSVSAEGP